MEKQPIHPVIEKGPTDELAYQLKIHLLGVSPQIYRRLMVRADTTLAQLHHIFQVVMGWENWHLHSFHIWGKQYGIRYGGMYFADDANQVRLGDFPWRVNDKFSYTYDFTDYWLHQVRIEKIQPASATLQLAFCLNGQRACPPEEIGGIEAYRQRTLDQLSWQRDLITCLLEREPIEEQDLDVPDWFWTYRPEHFDRATINQRLAKLYQFKGRSDFLYAKGAYDYFFEDPASQ
ncbi:plasmid pRiA4b ORF-3 family protein [Nibrella viscosa]|uniref:Plasmid pRiA4b ORF-3 family protein n=1 Tax=Nibrella viscosa TaxID=1084524 RepID=A0ABP8L0E3_9BACT